jgi:methanogenic corrinoid protein MtbC1
LGEALQSLNLLQSALVDLNEEVTLSLAREILAEDEAMSIPLLQACQQAMKVVGERYQRHEYYLSALIVAGDLFKEVLDMALPVEPAQDGESEGTILLGTVAGDIHDIGKNLFAISLRGFGFRVIDLGVDVPPERFVSEVEQSHPDVVCLSGLLTDAFESMRETVQALRAHTEDFGYDPPVVLGGGTVEDRVCRWVGADSWSADAMEGVRICQQLVRKTTG